MPHTCLTFAKFVLYQNEVNNGIATVCLRSKILNRKVQFIFDLYFLCFLRYVFIMLCMVKENHMRKPMSLPYTRKPWWGSVFSPAYEATVNRNLNMVGPEGRAVCSWCTCDICIYLLYFSVSSSSITSFQGYEIGAVTMMQRKGSKQRCVMPRQASHLSLRKTENDIVNWGMDIWRAVPIFPYLTGLSKLNALSGTAGSDTVTLLILGEMISGLFSQFLFSLDNIRFERWNQPRLFHSTSWGAMWTPLWQSTYFSFRNFPQTQGRVNQFTDKVVSYCESLRWNMP